MIWTNAAVRPFLPARYMVERSRPKGWCQSVSPMPNAKPEGLVRGFRQGRSRYRIPPPGGYMLSGIHACKGNTVLYAVMHACDRPSFQNPSESRGVSGGILQTSLSASARPRSGRNRRSVSRRCQVLILLSPDSLVPCDDLHFGYQPHERWKHRGVKGPCL